MTTKKFNEFGITNTKTSFKGDKIKIERLLNREITVHAFKIEDSKKQLGTQYLNMQISINDIYYVVFTGAKVLMEDIQRVPVDGFPFLTTIVKDNDWLKFT
ncbi:MAG: hypothetical protein ACXVAY_01515 [Mucilaginibacter sp.]